MVVACSNKILWPKFLAIFPLKLPLKTSSGRQWIVSLSITLKFFCGLHSPSRTIYPEAGTKFKKSRFAEHPNLHQLTQETGSSGKNFWAYVIFFFIFQRTPLFDVYYMAQRKEDIKINFPLVIFFPPVKYFSITILSPAAEPPNIS